MAGGVNDGPRFFRSTSRMDQCYGEEPNPSVTFLTGLHSHNSAKPLPRDLTHPNASDKCETSNSLWQRGQFPKMEGAWWIRVSPTLFSTPSLQSQSNIPQHFDFQGTPKAFHACPLANYYTPLGAGRSSNSNYRHNRTAVMPSTSGWIKIKCRWLLRARASSEGGGSHEFFARGRPKTRL